MVGKVVPAADFMLFRAIGEQPKAIIDTWNHIWSSDLKRTYTGDYQVYGKKFTHASPQEVEVWIAVAGK